jgi:hypothetical protein
VQRVFPFRHFGALHRVTSYPEGVARAPEESHALNAVDRCHARTGSGEEKEEE